MNFPNQISEPESGNVLVSLLLFSAAIFSMIGLTLQGAWSNLTVSISRSKYPTAEISFFFRNNVDCNSTVSLNLVGCANPGTIAAIVYIDKNGNRVSSASPVALTSIPIDPPSYFKDRYVRFVCASTKSFFLETGETSNASAWRRGGTIRCN